MNNCNENVSNSKQIYTHVKKSETSMSDVKGLMLDILKQYQKIDKVGMSLGVMDKSSSFSDAVSWCSVVGKLDHNKKSLDDVSKKHLAEAVSYLENLTGVLGSSVIQKVQEYRDKWMRRVLVWDFFMVSMLFVFAFLGLLKVGVAPESELLYGFVLERPLFFSLSSMIVVAVLLIFHFFIRAKVVKNMAKNIEEKLPPGMSLIKALIHNSGILHSIFRPDPVGWNIKQRLRLKSIKSKTAGLHQQLEEVLANYSEAESA